MTVSWGERISPPRLTTKRILRRDNKTLRERNDSLREELRVARRYGDGQRVLVDDFMAELDKARVEAAKLKVELSGARATLASQEQTIRDLNDDLVQTIAERDALVAVCEGPPWCRDRVTCVQRADQAQKWEHHLAESLHPSVVPTSIIDQTGADVGDAA